MDLGPAPRRKIQATILEPALLIPTLRIRALVLRLMGRVLQKMLAHRIRVMDLGPVAVRRKIQS